MIGFIFQILVRIFSGQKNANYYYKDYNRGLSFSVFMCICFGVYGVLTNTLIFQILPVLATYKMCNEFEKRNMKYIHLGEYFIVHSFTLICLLTPNMDWIGVTIGSLLGNEFFNMPIQKKFTGNYINKVSITDDLTGKYLGVYIFGRKFKIPRISSNGYVRLGIASFLTLFYIINLFTFKYTITINDIWNLLKSVL